MKQQGFTLVELLIVVAIIGILALIVIPNFLTAQIKAKMARSQADVKSVADALAMYRMEYNAIPYVNHGSGGTITLSPQHLTFVHRLTTPVNYISTGGLVSPFGFNHGYFYYNWDFFVETSGQPRDFFWNNISNREAATWMISTLGPSPDKFPWEEVGDGLVMFHEYNPSNGIDSGGVIQKHGQ